MTKLAVPTMQPSPISQPASITEFGAIQQPLPIFALPLITLPAVIWAAFFTIEL